MFIVDKWLLFIACSDISSDQRLDRCLDVTDNQWREIIVGVSLQCLGDDSSLNIRESLKIKCFAEYREK